MKLLFDQNISHRIISKIKSAYPHSSSIKELQLDNATDMQIWNFAKENNFSIVTFDSDFYDLATLFGYPPKIIWLRLGNISTSELSLFLENKSSIISEFIENPVHQELSCLELVR